MLVWHFRGACVQGGGLVGNTAILAFSHNWIGDTSLHSWSLVCSLDLTGVSQQI